MASCNYRVQIKIAAAYNPAVFVLFMLNAAREAISVINSAFIYCVIRTRERLTNARSGSVCTFDCRFDFEGGIFKRNT